MRIKLEKKGGQELIHVIKNQHTLHVLQKVFDKGVFLT